MDGRTEARKGEAELETVVYCRFLCARVKSRRRVRRARVLTKSCTGSVTPWIASNDSNRGARKRKATACWLVAVDQADKLVARVGSGRRIDSELRIENPSSECRMAPANGTTKEATARAAKSWKPRPPDDIGKCAMFQACVSRETSVMLCPVMWAKKAAVEDWRRVRKGELQEYGSKSSWREGKCSNISVARRWGIEGKRHLVKSTVWVCKSSSWFWIAFRLMSNRRAASVRAVVT